MNHPLTAMGVAFVFGLVACGSDDGPTEPADPPAPVGPEPYQLQVTGEWSRTREAPFEDATWRFYRLPADYPVTEIGGEQWSHDPVTSGLIGRDGVFTVLLPNNNKHCSDTWGYDYYLTVSGRYAANTLRCSALANVECTDEPQHITHWTEHGSCIPGGEPAPVSVTLDITATWDGGGTGSWELRVWHTTGYDTPEVFDSGHIPESGVFRFETTLTCPIDYDWSLRDLWISATIYQHDRSFAVKAFGGPVECTDAAQVQELWEVYYVEPPWW